MTEPSTSTDLTLHVNDRECVVTVSADDTLYDVLRTKLGLTSCRETCGLGVCGSCTVLVDGDAVSSCLAPAFALEGSTIRTAEGLESGTRLSRVQEEVVAQQAFQCSFCTPGFLMSASALLNDDRDVSADIDAALSGHLCRCGSYEQIVAAIRAAIGPRHGERDRKENGDRSDI